MIIHANNENYDIEVLKSDKLVLVDFFATWCGPCQMLGPVLEAFSKKNKDINVVKVDIDEMRDLAIDSEIEYVPTLVLFKNGKEIKRTSGMLSNQELEEFVEVED